MRQTQLQRHLLRRKPLAWNRRVRRPAAHGEVVSRKHDGTVIDPSGPKHEIRWREVRQVAVLVVLGDASGLADLVERAGIGDRVDPLADGQLAKVMLAFDLVGAPECLSERLAAPQLF